MNERRNVASGRGLFREMDGLDVFDVHGQPLELDELSLRCRDEKQCILQTGDAGEVTVKIPILDSDRVRSVVSLATESLVDSDEHSAATGVIEIWKPVGQHGELALAEGAFGSLDRFQNVTSFIRFEHGSGLPGLVWSTRRFVLHCDLPNHPAFLRGAGASADRLDVAIGIPIENGDDFSTLVLISSKETPMADGIEIWSLENGRFMLNDAYYRDTVDQELRYSTGDLARRERGLAGLALQHGAATVSSNPSILNAGRTPSHGWESGLAIPNFISGEFVEVALLLRSQS